MQTRLNITLNQLQSLLEQQKEKVIEKLASNSYLYNQESTDSYNKPLPIDKEKMMHVGIKAAYPDDFNTLKKYLEDN